MILIEKIDDMRKFYPKLTDEEFNQCIELDPTYKKGSDKAGNYAKWILSLASRGKLDNPGHVKDLLQRFEYNKNNLHDKNIMRFTTIVDLEDYLNDESSYKVLSARQQLRKTQKAVHNTDVETDAEHVFSSSNWDVYIPKTYEASCKLGRGTTWCTASTETDYYYNSYSSQGPLYININKNGDKYQFHFQSGQYMDKDDREIYISDFLKQHTDLKDYYTEIIATQLFKLTSDEVQFTIDPSTLEDIFGHIIAGRGYVNGDFAYQLISNPWEAGDGWDFTGYFNTDYIHELDSTSCAKLKELTGLTESEAQKIVEDSDDDNEYYSALFNSYSRATDDAYWQGTIVEAHNDAVKGLYDAFPSGWKVEYKYDGLRCSTNKETLVNTFLSDDIDQDTEYSEDPFDNLVYSIITSNYMLYEPYHGWEGFDEEVYNNAFRNNLEEELGE